MKTVYSLKEFEGLDRAHIFDGVITQEEPLLCNTHKTEKSCCGKIKQADYKQTKLVFGCQTAPSALVMCIKSKTAICASCEQHIFKKFQELAGRV